MLEDKLAGVEARYLELERLLENPEVVTDYERVAKLSKEKSSLEEVVILFRQYKQSNRDLAEAKAMLEDAEMRDMAEEELERLEDVIPNLENQLKRLLLPKDPRDGKDVIMEIRAGAGGDEAGIFAGDLFRMYSRYAEIRGWKLEVLDTHETGVGDTKL